MIDFTRARLNMVNAQLATNGIHNEALLEAYTHLPRETLVPEGQRMSCYIDEDMVLPNNRLLLEPMTEARMVQAALGEGPRSALVLGAASLPAIAMLARFIDKVTVVEPEAAMLTQATEQLSARDNTHVTMVNAAFDTTAAPGGPFDVIVAPGALARIAPHLMAQLSENGRLIAILRETPRDQGRIIVARRLADGTINVLPIADASTPYLAGFAPTGEFVF